MWSCTGNLHNLPKDAHKYQPRMHAIVFAKKGATRGASVQSNMITMPQAMSKSITWSVGCSNRIPNQGSRPTKRPVQTISDQLRSVKTRKARKFWKKARAMPVRSLTETSQEKVSLKHALLCVTTRVFAKKGATWGQCIVKHDHYATGYLKIHHVITQMPEPDSKSRITPY